MLTLNAPIDEVYHAVSFKRAKSTETVMQFFDESDVDCKDVIIKLLAKSENEVELRSGPKCNQETFLKVRSAIEEEVLKSTPGVGRSIIFSDEQIQGYFRYSNKFQILPPPADAPKPKGSAEWTHPLLLEFTFDKSSNEIINNYRSMKTAFELSSLLNLFLNRRVWMRDFTLRKGWVDCDDDRVTKLCTLLYGYKFSRTNKYSDFKDTKDYKPIPSIDQSDYFHPQNSLYRVGDLKVPSNLNELLDKVFRLHNEKREKLLNVAKLYSIASKLWDVSETAAYLTTVNTIESILPTSTEKTCETCGKRLEGLTNKFKEFMDRNASDYDDDELIKVKNKIYRTRGKITHGGILLGEDRNPYWSKPFMDKHATEGHILRCLVRKAIINWFIEW